MPSKWIAHPRRVDSLTRDATRAAERSCQVRRFGAARSINPCDRCCARLSSAMSAYVRRGRRRTRSRRSRVPTPGDTALPESRPDRIAQGGIERCRSRHRTPRVRDVHRLMLSVAIGQRVGENRHEHVWPKRSDDRNDVGDKRVARPIASAPMSAFLATPKSNARVKNDTPPSMRRAASNSCVRMAPSATPPSLPDEVVAGLASRQREITRFDRAAAGEPGR